MAEEDHVDRVIGARMSQFRIGRVHAAELDQRRRSEQPSVTEGDPDEGQQRGAAT
jgi:hypothetical protein